VIADEEHDLVAQLLEPPHELHEHRMTQVQIGRGGVEAGLDAQRPALSQARRELTLDLKIDDAALELLELLRDRLIQPAPARPTLPAQSDRPRRPAAHAAIPCLPRPCTRPDGSSGTSR